jgi:signal transduction histidine kinase
MQNRVRLMGGTFEIHSTKGEGTVVTLRVPIA